MTLAFVLGLVIATAATAGAAHLITGKDIKNGSIGRGDLDQSIRKQLAKAGTAGPAGLAGPAGPAGPAGAPGQQGPSGPATGPAGGDLVGSYPDPRARPAVRAAVKPPDPAHGCATDFERLCRYDGSGGLGNFGFFNNPVSIISYVGYYDEPGGTIQFQGGVQFVPSAPITGSLPALYLAPGHRPAVDSHFAVPAFPVDNTGAPDTSNPESGYVTVLTSGEVVLGRGGGKAIGGVVYDLDSVRIHTAPGA